MAITSKIRLIANWLGSLAALPWLAGASAAYFVIVRVLQDYRYAGRDYAAEVGQWFSIFHYKPEPLETSLYLLGLLAIPLLAAVAHAAWQRPLVRRASWAVALVGLLAVGLRHLPKLTVVAARFDPAAVAAYLQRRGLGHALWLVLTKRTFLNVVLVVLIIALTAAAAWWLNERRRTRLQAAWQRGAARRWPTWTPLIVIVVLAAILWHPNLPYEEHHYGYWLGPANDQLHGKQWLVETQSQYGLLSHLALVGLFGFTGRVSYETFSLVNQVSFLLYFAGLYLLLRQWLKSEIPALLGLGVLVAGTYWLMISPTITAYDYPGLSPFRFGLYVPAALLWLAYAQRGGHDRRGRWALEACLAVAGLAPLWNTDSGVYLAAAVGAAAVADAVAWGQGPLRRRLLTAAARLVRLAGYTALGLLAISGGVRLTSGAWPNWSAVVAEVATYAGGRALNPLPIAGGFLLFVVGYLAAGLWVVRRTVSGRAGADDRMVLLLALYGVLSFNYYIGNSAWNLLFPVAGPLLLLWIFFSHRWLRSSPHRWLVAASVASFGVAAFIWAVKLPVELGHRDYAASVTSRPADAALSRDALRLRAEYGSLPRLALVHTRGAKLLILARKPNALPFYDLTQLYFLRQFDDLIADARRRQLTPLFVGVDADPVHPDPQVAYVRQRALDGYVRVARYETLEVFTLATSSPAR